MTAGQELLAVRDLCVRYPTGRSLTGRPHFHTAVDGVSFEITAGETFGLVGESGCGKSTIGRAILRLVKPHAGAIVFEGEDVTAWPEKTPLRYRRAVQAVFQDPLSSLNPRMQVGDAVHEAVRFHSSLPRKDARRRVEALFADVGLARYHASRYPRELSGGQQQRVAIARALAPDPQLVVCDEAVSALDVSTQAQVINLLMDLQAEHGLSYLFISHDLSVVRHISNRVGVLCRGELVEVEEVDEVFLRPRHEYTRTLLGAIPNIRAKFSGNSRPSTNLGVSEQ